jgi:hypothetical protein
VQARDRRRRTGSDARHDRSGSRHTRPLERASVSEKPRYEVQDQRYSGEWRAIAQFIDPGEAQQAAAVIRSAGGNVRILFIERR